MGSAQRSRMQCVTRLGAGALPRAAIRSWFTCPGRASYLVKAAYPVVITAIIWSTAKAVASSKFHGTEPPRSDMEAIIEA